jgi:hypothetical protein
MGLRSRLASRPASLSSLSWRLRFVADKVSGAGLPAGAAWGMGVSRALVSMTVGSSSSESSMHIISGSFLDPEVLMPDSRLVGLPTTLISSSTARVRYYLRQHSRYICDNVLLP